MIMEEHGASLKTSHISSSEAIATILLEANGERVSAHQEMVLSQAKEESCSWHVSVRQALIL